MEELPSNNSTSPHSDDPSPTHQGFKKAIFWLSFMVIYALIFQNIHDWLTWHHLDFWSRFIAGFAVLGVIAMAFFKPFYQIIDTPPFSISGILAVATGTALGTFVSQNAQGGVFTQRYGKIGSDILRSLKLDDVFHSWWYVGLFILLAVSLIKISSKKKFNRGNLGFHLAHLCPIIIMLGFWVDYFYGYGGIIKLEEGQSKSIVKVDNSSSNFLKDSTGLDFRIRLDKFEFEKHGPDYRIQIWKLDTSSQAQMTEHSAMPSNLSPKIVASLAPEPMKTHHIYGTDIYFRLIEFYSNFYFEYTYPPVSDTIEAKDPGIQMMVKVGEEEVSLQLRANQPGRNKISDAETLGGSLEFYWELPEDVLKAILQKPAGATMNRVIFAGKDEMIYYFTDGKLTNEKIEKNRYYALPAKDNVSFKITHLFPDAAYLKAVPANKNDQLVNPLARVEIWHKNSTSNEAYLYPASNERNGGTHAIIGTNFILAFESMKDRETKFYKSDLSVLGENDEVLKQQVIKVNEPMLYGGYRFYQTDYDPNNPSYSGIGVSFAPGLYVIYFGFFVLVAGVGLMFYNRNRKQEQVPTL